MTKKDDNAILLFMYQGEISSQATIEGRLPIPEGRYGTRPVFATGNIEVTQSRALDGAISTEGEVVISAICVDENGELYSFTSHAPFSHEVEFEDAHSQTHVRTAASLIELNVEADGSDALKAQAAVEFIFTPETPKSLQTANTDGVTVPIEVHKTILEYIHRDPVVSVKSRIREEIALPEIASVVYSSATAAVREIRLGGSELCVECILNVDALCIKRNGDYMQLTQSVPVSIREDCHTDASDVGTLGSQARVSDISLRALGEEFGIISVDAVVGIDVYTTQKGYLTFPDDAYTPERGKQLIPERTEGSTLLYRGERELKSVFSEEIALGEKAATIIYTGVRPVITSALKTESGTTLQGIAQITVVYSNETGAILSTSEERAFSIATDMSGNNIEAETVGGTAYGSLNGNGESAMVSLNIAVRAKEYEERPTTPVTAIVVEDDAIKRAPGFTVYFAGEGETAFDIGKRFKVSQEALEAMNPKLKSIDEHGLSEGDSVVMLL